MASSDHFRDKTAKDEPQPSILPNTSILPNNLAGKRWPVKYGIILLPIIPSLGSAAPLNSKTG
jgi:hypothetical protein